MAEWKVKVKVTLQDVLEFERTVEADSELEAESAAEDDISEDDILTELKKNGDPVGMASYECEATTNAVQCKGCDTLYAPNELDENGNCEECSEEEDEEEEEEVSK